MATIKEAKDYKICLYTICKNESKFVKQWLDNMKGADYIVVLDTGSTDGTYEMLKADPRVTKVEQKVIKPWRFDVARNESLKLVPDDADILISTDFDELFNEGWADIVRAAWAQGQAQGGVNRVFYKYAWSHNEAGEPTDIFLYDKIHDRNFIWKFPVHEVLWPVSPDVQVKGIRVDEQLFLQHYPDKSKERHYYFDLLNLAVQENPNDAHERMLLAREYLLNHDYPNALIHYKAVLEMPDAKTPEKRFVYLESIGRCADLYRQAGDKEMALHYCYKFIQEDPTYREPYLIAGNIYNELNLPTLAEAMMKAMLEYTTRKNSWVERADSWVAEADDILSIAQFALGKVDDAIDHVQIALKHHPDDPRLLKNLAVFLSAKLNVVNDKLQKQELAASGAAFQPSQPGMAQDATIR